MSMQHWSSQLHQAASEGDHVLLQCLLEQGHPPNSVGGSKCWLRGASEINTRTPLHYSAKGGHLLCVRLLLRYGADPNARDGDGYTPIHYICQIHNPKSDAREGVWLCLTSLVEFGGDTTVRTNSGHTPLMLARWQKNVVCAKELLKQGMYFRLLQRVCETLVTLSAWYRERGGVIMHPTSWL